jgi:CubicO group peptidase (beta-lactamase class C family)
MNYIIAGAMIERVGGKTWEELITERIFTPLGLRTAGVGCQATLGRVDAPLGHEMTDGKLKAMLAGPNGDAIPPFYNPAIFGPAGLAHMSVLDFARWAAWNAGEGKRGPKLVRPETLKKLHTPVISIPIKNPAPGTPTSAKYALGWGQVVMDWAPEPLIKHGGDNGLNHSQIWVDPKRDFAMVLVTNLGGLKAVKALDAIAPELYAKFGPRSLGAERGRGRAANAGN